MYKIAFKREAPSTSYIILPVNPEKFSVKIKGKNDYYDLLEIGEVVIPYGAGLRSFSFSSLFPADREPKNYVAYLENLLLRKAPVRLIVVDTLCNDDSRMDLNLPVVIESFEYWEQGGEPGTIYYHLNLSEYREYQAEVIQ